MEFGVKEMVYILDMGGKEFNKGLEVGIGVRRDTFSGGTIEVDNGTTRVTRSMYLRK